VSLQDELEAMMRKLNRLREMPAEEIAYRIREKLRTETDRIRWLSGMGPEQDGGFGRLFEAGGFSVLSWLMHGPAKRFYGSVSLEQRGPVRDFVFRYRPEWLDRSVRQCQSLLAHELNVLGYSNVALDGTIDWHRDPVTGHVWPRRYWADYDLVSFRADSKIVHELNRHQHLPRLAKTYFLTGEGAYAREAIAQMESWIRDNPRETGVNWNSSLEIAIRCISWMWTMFALLASQEMDEIPLRTICKSLFEQLDHVYRYPSIYSSPNTHLIGEASALFIAGVVFAEVPAAGDWRQFGARVLMKEMDRQVNEEGVYGELSTCYHCYAADFYLQAMLLANRNRFVFPEWMWKSLARMFDLVSHITRGDGTIPLLGDDDGGRALSLASQDYRSFRDGLSTAAIQFGRPDFKHQCGEYAEESMWLLGQDSWKVFDSLDSHPPVPGYVCPKAGYFIHKFDDRGSDSHLVFDCGSLGMGAAGHGHADALSIVLFTGGTDLLVDPGTGVYNASPEWRDYFRSTRAHNTVVVDGCDQSEPAGTFNWASRASSEVLNCFALPGIRFVDGEHEVFGGLQQPI
jgi:hypothetical protein